MSSTWYSAGSFCHFMRFLKLELSEKKTDVALVEKLRKSYQMMLDVSETLTNETDTHHNVLVPVLRAVYMII